MPKVKFFKNSQSQKKMGNAAALFPRGGSWQLLFDSLNKFSNDFLDVRVQPKQCERDDILMLEWN